MVLSKKQSYQNQKVYMDRNKPDLLNMMRTVKLYITTFTVMFVSFLFLLSFAIFGIEIPFLFLIYVFFFEAMLIFFLTVLIARRNRSYKL
jgi:hypothetical protein